MQTRLCYTQRSEGKRTPHTSGPHGEAGVRGQRDEGNMRARTFAVVCTERNRRGWVRRLGIGPGVIRGGGAWPGVCFQRHRKDAGVLPPGGHRRHGWGCGLWRVALHLEGVLPAELGTSSTKNGTMAPRGCLQELPEGLGSRLREGQQGHGLVPGEGGT